MKRLVSLLLVAVACLWPTPRTSAFELSSTTLARELRPFVDALGGRTPLYTISADATFTADKKPQHATLTLSRTGPQGFTLAIDHPEYPLVLIREADRTILALPNKHVEFIGEGPVSGDDTLAPDGALQRLVSDGCALKPYLGTVSPATLEVAAFTLPKLTGVKTDDHGHTWTGGKLRDGRVAFDAQDHVSIEIDKLSAKVSLAAKPTTPAIPADLKVVKLDRAEMERLFARGARRTLEVVAPASTLTQPKHAEVTLSHGQLRWNGDQRLCLLWGTPQQIGQAHGTLLKTEARRCADSALYMIGIVSTVGKGSWFLNDLRDAYARLEPHIPAAHKAEIDATADAAGISRDEGRLANVFPELFHCSGFALFGKATVDGKLYHGRVLDYMTMIGLQDAATTFVIAPDGKIPFANVGYAGFIGSVSGMNAKQISLGEMGGRGEGLWDGVPMATLMRRGLEECSTLDEVKALWSINPRTCNYYYVFADGKIPDACGVAATPEKVEFLKPGQSHELLGDGIPDAVVLSAGKRLTELRRRVQEGYGHFDVAKAMALMTRPVTMDSNLHDVLFIPQDGVFYVANADHKHPACERPYEKYDLNALVRSMHAPQSAAAR